MIRLALLLFVAILLCPACCCIGNHVDIDPTFEIHYDIEVVVDSAGASR